MFLLADFLPKNLLRGDRFCSVKLPFYFYHSAARKMRGNTTKYFRNHLLPGRVTSQDLGKGTIFLHIIQCLGKLISQVFSLWCFLKGIKNFLV